METIMRKVVIAAAAVALTASPARAGQEDRPVTDKEVGAGDVAMTPLTDLNLKKQDIPILLLDAQLRPYDLTGLRRCRALIAEVRKLDSVLGEDVDIPQADEDRTSPGRIAKSIVGSFIPFRGILREITGANDQERRLANAVQAGMIRRGFLKGIGSSRGCAYPGRPGTQQQVDLYLESLTDDDRKKIADDQRKIVELREKLIEERAKDKAKK
jgi:hypothetical protein